MADLSIDSQSVLGVFLPNVYIGTVTLDRTVNAPSKKDNPHIWDPVFNPNTKEWEKPSGDATQQAIQASLQDVDSELNESSNTTTTLTLMLKEKVAPDSQLTFILKEDIWKYLKIKVVQSPFQIATKQLILKPKTYFTPDTGLFDQPPTPADVVGGGGRNLFESVSAMQVAELVSKHCEVINISVKDIAEGLPNKVFTSSMEGNSNLGNTPDYDLRGFDQFITETDTSGNKVYSIPFNVKFDVKRPQFGWEQYLAEGQTGGYSWPTNKPHHLAYFAVAYLDLNEVALKEEFDILEIPQEVKSELSLGKVTSDTIISNGAVASHGTILLDQAGQIWSGDVHKMPDGRLMKGHEHEISLTPTGAIDYNKMQSKYLTAKVVPFSKVQDFREMQDISRLDFNFGAVDDDPEVGLQASALLNKFLSPANSQITKAQKAALNKSGDQYKISNLKGETPLFSDLHLSLNRNASASFLFTVNFAEMVKKNSAFPNLVTLLERANKAELVKLLKKARIAEMTIKSRRVVENSMGQNNLGTPTTPRPYSDDEKPLVIAMNSELNSTEKPAINGKTFIEKMEPHFGMPFLPPDTHNEYYYRGSLREEDIEHIQLTGKPGHSKWPVLRTFTGVDWTVGKIREWRQPAELNTPSPAKGGSLQWDRPEHVPDDKIKTGVYQYLVEMEVMDPTVAYLAEKLEDLKQVLYGTQTTMGFKDYYEDSKRDPEFFNQYLNRFTKKFNDYIKSDPTHTTTSVERDALGRPINLVEKTKQYEGHLITKLSKFVSTFAGLAGISNVNKTTWIAMNLWKYCNPQSGTIKGIEVVVNLMETIVNRIENSIDSVLNTNKSKTKLPDIDVVEGSLKSANVTFKIEHYFNETFDATQPSHVGMDYLSSNAGEAAGTDAIYGMNYTIDPIANKWGPRILHPQQFYTRAQKEMQKYFPEGIDNIALSVNFSGESVPTNILENISLSDEMFSYLTPSFIRHSSAPPGIYSNLSEPATNDSFLSTAVLNIVSHNKSRERGKEAMYYIYDKIEPIPQISKEDQVLRANLLSFFGDEGCIVKTITEDQYGAYIGSSVNAPWGDNKSGFKDILSDDSEQIVNNVYKGSIFKSSINPNEFLFALMFADNFDLGNYIRQSRMFNLGSSLSPHPLKTVFKQWQNFQQQSYGIQTVQNTAITTLKNPIQTLPYQLKSRVIEASSPTGEQNPSPTADGWMKTWAKYKNLVRIEKLTGYSNTKDGKVNLKAPNWDPVTPADFGEVDFIPAKTLCRLVRYNHPLLSEANDLLELPINDKYFLTSRYSTKENLYTGPKDSEGTTKSSAAMIQSEQGIPVYPTDSDLETTETSKGFTGKGKPILSKQVENKLLVEGENMGLASPEATSTNHLAETKEETKTGPQNLQQAECPEGQRYSTELGICVEETKLTHEDKGGGQMDKGSTY